MDWLTLIRTPRLGNAGALRLLQHCGSAAGCFTSDIPTSRNLHAETRAYLRAPERAVGEEAAAPEDPEYRLLLNSLDVAPTSVDALVERTGLTPDEVSSMLLMLELQGHVETAPSGRYSRVNKRS